MTAPGREERARRRAQLRATHPDLGGDPLAFAAALDRHRVRPAPPVDVLVVARPTLVGTVVTPVRTYVRRRLVRHGLLAGRVQ